MNAPSAPPPIFDGLFEGRKAWVRTDIQRDDWFLRLTPECLAELREVVLVLRAHPCAAACTIIPPP